MSDWTCAEVGELAPELALGTLPGDQRASVLGHLDTCPACRELVKELSDVADQLLALAPEVEPPVAFTRRVSQAMTGAPARRWARPSSLRLGRGRLVAVGVAVVLAGALIFGLLPGRLSPGDVAVRAANFVPAPGQAARGEGAQGRVYARADHPSWVFMTVKVTVPAGQDSTERYACQLVLSDGSRQDIGTFAVRAGSGSWGRSVDVPVGRIRGVNLVDATGATVATATLSS